MTPNIYNKPANNYKTALKLIMPTDLSDELKKLATERAISLSALIRLALTEYVRSKQ